MHIALFRHFLFSRDHLFFFIEDICSFIDDPIIILSLITGTTTREYEKMFERIPYANRLIDSCTSVLEILTCQPSQP